MDAYAAVRKWAPDCFFVVSPRNWEQDGAEWQNFMTGGSFTKVLQDLHKCGVVPPERPVSFDAPLHVLPSVMAVQIRQNRISECCVAEQVPAGLGWAQFGSMTVAQHTTWAEQNRKRELTTYIERGGLPPIIGEWALAGLWTLLVLLRSMLLPLHHTPTCVSVSTIAEPACRSLVRGPTNLNSAPS